ncbi:hypothetical protein [Nocardioides sp. zg-DK7169]|uniref:hypothetical protein n=1 Tax=Nocardioides sp. zg-DK7169 TaxID=2736600 RepID=UPI0015525FC3|nr:hypothetical protein [Nocardioides sp. zg-DK7169]NPC97932.1 hypothetical protein [Nocardioides sp. zg-DK7169]
MAAAWVMVANRSPQRNGNLMSPYRLRACAARGLAIVVIISLSTLSQASASEGAPIPDPVADSISTRAETGFPTARTTGVPRGWAPQRTVYGDVRVTDPGSEISDVRIVRGDLIIDAPDVTVRRVELRGGRIENFPGATCQTGLDIIDTTVRPARGQQTSGDVPSIGTGGYTATGVKIVGTPEGFRVGGKSACGGVVIQRSFVRVVSPDICEDWHGDALQGYDGGDLVLRDSVLRLVERDGCGGTAPFFYPADQGNSSVDIDGLVVAGGGYAFRLGQPGTVRRLYVETGSGFYGPTDVTCSLLGAWEASISALGADGQPTTGTALPCTT